MVEEFGRAVLFTQWQPMQREQQEGAGVKIFPQGCAPSELPHLTSMALDHDPPSYAFHLTGINRCEPFTIPSLQMLINDISMEVIISRITTTLK
jgi:hypothetical protein